MYVILHVFLNTASEIFKLIPVREIENKYIIGFIQGNRICKFQFCWKNTLMQKEITQIL